MSEVVNKDVVRQFYAAGNRGDIEFATSLMSNEISWTVMGNTRFSGTQRGKQNLLENLIGPLFGQLRAGISTQVDLLLAEGDHVVALNRGTAETQAGVTYNNSYCHIFRLQDGKIVEVIEYLDTALTDQVFGR